MKHAETNMVLIEVEDTLIGNGHAVRIAGQVFDHIVHSGKGLFGKNDPFLLIQVFFPAIKSGAMSGNVLG